MFSDFGNYKTSVDILGTALQSVKGQAMAADWDDWGEAEEMETSVMAGVMEPELPQFSSMVAHIVVTGSPWGQWRVSAASHSVVSGQDVYEAEDKDPEEEECLASSVTHCASSKRTSELSHVEAVISKLQHSSTVPANVTEPVTMEADGDKIAQVDGINDESSDEDMEQDDEDEHLVPDPEVSQPESVHFQEDSDSSMSVQDVTSGQPENNQRDDKSDSDTEVEQDIRGEDRDDSSEDDEDSKDSINRHDNNEISNEAGESRNYASDFDDEVNERRRSDDESSVSTEGYVQDDVRDPDTKDDAPEVQSDSDIEEVAEIEEVRETQRRPHYDDEEEGDDDRDEQYDEENESEHSEEESEYEEEDISEDVPVKQPCILVFDSLGGRKDRQARLCAVLRDYLTMEYQEKYPGQKREFSTKTIPGCAPEERILHQNYSRVCPQSPSTTQSHGLWHLRVSQRGNLLQEPNSGLHLARELAQELVP